MKTRFLLLLILPLFSAINCYGLSGMEANQILQTLKTSGTITHNEDVPLSGVSVENQVKIDVALSESSECKSLMSSIIVDLPYNKSTTLQNTTAPVTVITGEELLRYPGSNLMEALTGKIPNMQILRTDYSPGGPNREDASDVSMSIRGFGYTTLVDGVERSLDDLSAYEVETITVLRGLSARAMYGYTAANGLIIVKTKRGKSGKREISANVEYGRRVTDKTRMPEWLNAYDYATLFNRAAINDGADPVDVENLPYSPEYLEGYRTGSNPLKYFDERLYDEIFNNSMDQKNVNLNYRGGSETTNYFFNLNYFGEGKGYLKNKDNTFDQLRLRSNVDVDVTDDFNFSVDVLTSLQFRKSPLDMDAVWGALGKYPVNAYPIVIAPDSFGTHATFSRNPVADIIKRNYNNRFDFEGQVNIGFEYDFGKFIKGLSADAYLSYDAYSYQNVATEKNFTYATYQPLWTTSQTGVDSMYLRQYGLNQPDAGFTRTEDRFTSRIGAFANLNYQQTFGKHQIEANLNGFLQSITRKGSAFDDRRLNYSLTANYAFKNKYFVDLIMSLTGNQNLPQINRYKTFPSLGFGWMLSEENFIKSVSAIDELKLRISYGTQGFYNGPGKYLYITEWRTLGNSYFDKDLAGAQVKTMRQVYVDHDGNPSIDWGTVAEFNAGLDGVFFKNKLILQLDYYNNRTKGIVMGAMVPGVMGMTSYYDNIGENKYQGVDGYISYSDKIGDFSYSFGANAGFNTSEIIADNLPEYEYEWLNHVGNPVDAIYSFNALGLFKDEDDIANSPEQTYGAVLPGNIKYEDLNGDGKVTSNYDKKMIGHTDPRFTYGVNLNIGYKRVQLYILGYGMSHRDVDVQSNVYYHMFGNNKYSKYIQENAWTKGYNEDPNALHPRLTTGNVRNDNLTSTYWLRNTAFFKIKNVELSYMLPEVVTNQLKISNIKLFVRGTNLLTFSEINELDPENLSLGVTKYPSARTFTGGLAINF
jgi:TonB-dependent starch-binding outer membrane protein SusC